MQGAWRAEPTQGREEKQGEDVEWREVGEHGVGLGPLDGLDRALEEVLYAVFSYLSDWAGFKRHDAHLHLRVGIDFAEFVG